MRFKLKDLSVKSKNCLDAKIEKPDDELVKVLISKFYQINKLKLIINWLNLQQKRITRSYGKIFEFIYKIDEISLKKKKSIDQKTIKEALGIKLNKYRTHNCSELTINNNGEKVVFQVG